MKLGEELKFSFTRDDLVAAIAHARNENFIDNLRDRNIFVAFDSKIRGYLGEISISKYFKENGIVVSSVDRMEDGDSMDLDFAVIGKNNRELRIECKTSLIPDAWANLEEVIKNGDIKIIKREQYFYQVPIDIHVQIYFNQFRRARDNFLSSIEGKPDDYTDDELIQKMKLDSLREVFIAWMDKESLDEFLRHQKYKTWKFGYRQFWRCPLQISKPPKDLPDYLGAKANNEPKNAPIISDQVVDEPQIEEKVVVEETKKDNTPIEPAQSKKKKQNAFIRFIKRIFGKK